MREDIAWRQMSAARRWLVSAIVRVAYLARAGGMARVTLVAIIDRIIETVVLAAGFLWEGAIVVGSLGGFLTTQVSRR